ncbi:P-loop containing nucleoside triphosphate hydrolase protein [Aspergillus avenaceus]|uniref:P-loop containing nucleoside triphosphate hydrolase protein n=1 Tax=Aspergillus avenaceus TaxID=36643 RepID=A0A5N6U4C7_ASPAV|nr:P-loop containing nucleoside triphosphate hydrolase protein [Aspergillus avenaceus]
MLSSLKSFLSQLCPCRKMECRQNTSRFPSLLSSLWGPRRSQQSIPVSTSTQTQAQAQAQTQTPAPAPAPAPDPSPASAKIDIASNLQKKRSAEQDRESRETAQKEIVDELQNLVGLENVKRQLVGVQNWVQICRRHGREPRNEWYNIVFQGNPGTGKSSIARIYAKLLYAIGICDTNTVKEVSGRELALKGVEDLQRLIQEMVDAEAPAQTAGVLIIDNPQALSPGHNESHRDILDCLLRAMERKSGRIIVVFMGQASHMEKFLQQSPQVQRRTCSTVNFADFDRSELLQLLGRRITSEYNGKMQVEGGLDGQYMQAAARRLARNRGEGFTNVYAVRQVVEVIAHRQAECLIEQKDVGMDDVDYFFFSKDDVLGPNPSDVRAQSPAWTSLQSFVGQDAVKSSVREVFGTVEENYWREIKSQKRLLVRVNRVFAGPPGTGKTTAAKLYAKILADLGLLSSGEAVVKPLSAFSSMSHTDEILASTIGRALIIDMDTPDTDDSDSIRISESSLDMLIKELSANKENHCTILVGSDNVFDTLLPELRESSRMLEHQVVRFKALTREQMEELFQTKLQEQDVDATPEAFQAAMDILESARMRMDFDNARGIERLLTAANQSFDQKRSRTEGPLSQRVLEPEYFNSDLVGGKAALAFREELRHSIVPDDIISVLKRYHNEMKIAWLQGHEPKARVPGTLVFKGACGTGKKTVARHLSGLYYKMGVLKTAAVVECSVSDLVTTNMSHTSIRTRSQLDRARGKLLYVEDAHRLGDNEYTMQAMDELIYLLPKLGQELVVVLAGPSQELDHLLANKPRLASLFQEEIVFRNPTPRECLRLLDRRLEEEGVRGQRLFLTDPREATHREFTRAIQILSMFPCWGNSRDIELLARWMVSVCVRDLPLDGTALPEVNLSDEQAMACMIKLFNLKRDRLRFNQDPKARTLPRILSQPRCTERGGVRFPV